MKLISPSLVVGVVLGLLLAFPVKVLANFITWGNCKSVAYFALFAFILWNVSALLRAKASKEDRQ